VAARRSRGVSVGETRSGRPWIIPFFLPEMGCPRRCLFCNQHALAGDEAQPPTAAAVRGQLAHWLALPRRGGRQVELAFYGGSFTGLPRALQHELLAAVAPELAAGTVAAIRLSARPDQLEAEHAAWLVRQGVAVVELGVQSLDREVLRRSGRGYGPERVTQAVQDVRRAGLRVGCHLMVGLPGENTVRLVAGARALAALIPDFVRIHPALVLSGTGLARLLERGDYRPLTLVQAIARVGRLKKIFDLSAIPVLRMGLQATTALEASLLAGPYHPAFGELVLARLMFQQLRQQLRRVDGGALVRLAVNPRDLSQVRGPGRVNLIRLETLGLATRLRLVPDSSQPRHHLRRLDPIPLNPDCDHAEY